MKKYFIRRHIESFFLVWSYEYIQAFAQREKEKIFESDYDKLLTIAKILKEIEKEE
jgi:hypothetical protein